MESTMQFDMMDDLLDFLTPAPRPAGLDYEGTSGKVLPSPAGNWWLGDSHAISPQDELQQDSMWCDHADGSLLSPVGQYGEVQYMDDVGSPEKLWFHDDDLMSQYKPISDLSVSSPSSHGPLASPHGPLASPLGPLALSPMEVKFELSMLDQSLLEQPACYNVDVGSGLESLELSMPLSKTLFSLQDYQETQDSTVPCSPLHDTTLVDLDAGDEDSLHEEEIVCQLLRELDSLGPDGLKTSATLLHVSPEEVESVLSRDSSYENLAALDEPTVSHRIQPAVSRQVESTVSRRVEPAVSHTTLLPVSRPTTLPTVLSTFIPSPPVSIASPVTILPFTIGSGYQQSSLISKIPTSQAGLSAQPYSRAEVLVERRQRKKEQNKTAALRYRQKKREEKGHTTTEVEELEQQNAALRSRADELSKEINYLKGLLEEIRR